MATNLVATVSKGSIHSLAHQGILVYESFHQIRELVLANLGDAYALLFAEPSPSKDGNAIDWYTPVQGTARRLVDLPEEEQKAARAATLRMAKDLARVAAELKQSGLASQVTRGTILELALQYPDESCIYVVGEQPLFTCWGFGPGTPGVQPQDLTRLGQAAVPPKAPAAVETPAPAPQAAPAVQDLAAPKKRGGVSWLWLLPLLLLFPLFFLLMAFWGRPLLPGFSLKGLPSLPFQLKGLPSLPFHQEAPVLSPEAELELAAEAEKLRAEINELEQKLLDRAEQCPPEAMPSGLEAEPEPEREALVIPGKPSDMNFLRGRWLLDRVLFNKSDNQPIEVIYEFDSNGKGAATVRQKGREDCVSSAWASINARGVLVIEVERQVCPDGRSYSAETIECSVGEFNRAMCNGKSDRGTDWGESVLLYREPDSGRPQAAPAE